MFRNRRRPRLARVAVTGAAAVLAVGVIAACSSGGSSSSSGASASASATGTKVAGGTATFGLPASVTLGYIFPFIPLAESSSYTVNQWQWLMYRPLYLFGGNNNSVAVNYPLSPAEPPVYSDSGKTVSITMKGWKWSNGETVDANDMVFWLNMMKAEKANFYGYSPGLAPDNITSYSATGPNTLVMHLNQAYSSIWFTYNQLAEFTPMPMAWDVTSLSAKAGSGGCTTDTAADKYAKCTAVYNFLAAQAKSASTYASSPIWGVVDGPWKTTYYNSNGNVTMSPNPAYSGLPKPSLTSFKYVPFTDSSTEYTALKTGQLDIGTVPTADLPQKPLSVTLPSTNPLGSGYNLQPLIPFGFNYFVPNMNNQTTGPMFKQLYIRQAMQMVMDQPGDSTAIWRGYAVPSGGAVPGAPANQWSTGTIQQTNSLQGPYPFSVANAKSLLTSHGWTETGGVMACTDPAKCGAGIKQGQQLAFTVFYATGDTQVTDEVSNYKSDAAQAGIKVNITGGTFNAVIGESTPCKPGPKCTWDVLWWGGWGYNGPGFEPTGEPLFQTGAGSNSGSYSDPKMDQLINATHTSSSLSVFHDYANYTAQQLPYIWTPNNIRMRAVSSKLANAWVVNPLYTILPEYWYFTK
jgi:peptide/nickel transport system substrate-binding protein